MTFLVTRNDSENWYKFKEFNTLEDLIEYKEHVYKEIILQRNFWYKEEIKFIIEHLEGVTLEDAKKMRETKYEICICYEYI